MDLGPHAGFIIASYAICFGVVAGLILWVRLDKSRLDSTLKDLESQGLAKTRRTPEKPDRQ
ncbi:heme exporter protein CcmD [uncultured Roseibium sp.]|uniref:heme exporter protein CcmD n=1 Tax=uncultured Roseibium sp. TaxID=1936171 RepID=UPI002594C9FF|nr:heme exporter protein CcmD [uncultured Roseibium sp.]